ncbi:MAG: SARP family transcriptional regulator [Actinobacteria bacterium]|nr:SARP family transcriptional regulator [Actinomycetota bacterium]
MTSTRISLLGSPSIARDPGPPDQPKGNKAWGLLTYLLLSHGPHTRTHLAELLFSNAEDPLGALRWNLSRLRKALGLPQSLRGNDLQLGLSPDSVVDVHILTTGTWTEAVRVRGLGRDLLEGVSFSSDPVFDTWLMLERLRVRSVERSVLREAAAACIGTGRLETAADFASRALAIDPFDEGSHEMLIRALAASGANDKAQEALLRCTRVFREELQCEPGAAVQAAVDEGRRITRISVSGSAAARAQLDLGRSAVRAGAIDTGIENLRAAVGAAEEGDDKPLLAQALLALAHALIHSVRGRDGEASTLLHRALHLADLHEMRSLSAECLRELGYIEMLIGGYDRALISLRRALDVGDADALDVRAWTLAYQAVCYSDTGRYDRALECLEECLSTQDDSAIENARAYAFCLLGRIQMLRRQLPEARAALESSVSLATRCGWLGLLPWPQALLAEVDLLLGAPATEVRVRLEHALSLAQQIGDPCWEGAAMHGLGLVEAASGTFDAAATRLGTASAVCARFPDSYIWMKAYILDALCDLTTRNSPSDSTRWISDLQNLAASTGMTEFLARAYAYSARNGDSYALSAAHLIAKGVDNPALHSHLDSIPSASR